MTLYAGETVQIRHHAEGYDGETLTGVDATVSVTIWDLDDAVLVDEAIMTYSSSIVFDDGTVGGWYFSWTTPDNPGSYLARCNIFGAGINAWEFKTIRVRRNKNE